MELRAHLLLAGVLALTTYGQIIVKMRSNAWGAAPSVRAYFSLMLTDPWVLSSFVSIVGAGLLWIAAIRRLELSYAYPFMALTFIIVPAASHFFIGEPWRLARVIGVGLIAIGVAVVAVDNIR